MQLSRFLQNSKGRDYEVRVAGFQGDLHDIDADYTLDSLLDFYGKSASKPVTGKNFQRYLDEIDTYKPDLILSDLEFFTTYAANELQIPYWIVSSFAIYFALTKQFKDSLGVSKHYRSILFDNKNFHRYQFQLNNADQRFIYHFLCDAPTPPELMNDCHWVRPYFVTSDLKIEPRFVAALSSTDKPFVKMISKMVPNRYYSNTSYENLHNNSHLDLSSPLYASDVKNALMLFSSGETSILADAAYNGKRSLIYPDYKSKESIVNSRLVEFFDLGEKIYTRKNFEQIYSLVSKDLSIKLNPDKNVKFLHEYIEDLL